VDLLGNPADQCPAPTIHSSDPAALAISTGDDLIYQHGIDIGSTHSGSTPGIASFTGFSNGATRSGFLYTDRATTLTGFCDRTISASGFTAGFLQNFDLHLHRGWNQVVAVFSIPQPGHIVSDLTVGYNTAEKWYFFRPPTTP
jgi:hypothetical protein